MVRIGFCWSLWWTRRPGMLRFMGSRRVGLDWATELNWNFLKKRPLFKWCCPRKIFPLKFCPFHFIILPALFFSKPLVISDAVCLSLSLRSSIVFGCHLSLISFNVNSLLRWNSVTNLSFFFYDKMSVATKIFHPGVLRFWYCIKLDIPH